MIRNGSVGSKVNESAIDIGMDQFDVNLLAHINLRRKIRNYSSLEHGSMGNSFKDRSVLSVGCVCHNCLHFQQWMSLQFPKDNLGGVNKR